MKYLSIIIIAISLFACSGNQSASKMKQKFSSIETIWVEVPDSTSNFEALLSTNELYYLRHHSTKFDSSRGEFWENIDTTKNDSWIIEISRSRACQNNNLNKFRNCIEFQTHTINKKNNKVIKFEGAGSGYAAQVEFIYDELGNLIEYRKFSKIGYLEYDAKNGLTEVLITELNFGVSAKEKVIKFK